MYAVYQPIYKNVLIVQNLVDIFGGGAIQIVFSRSHFPKNKTIMAVQRGQEDCIAKAVETNLLMQS